MIRFLKQLICGMSCLLGGDAITSLHGAISFEKKQPGSDKFDVQPLCNKWAHENAVSLPKDVTNLLNRFTGLRTLYEEDKQELLSDLEKGIKHLAYYSDDDRPIIQNQILEIKEQIKEIKQDQYRLTRIHNKNSYMDYIY